MAVWKKALLATAILGLGGTVAEAQNPQSLDALIGQATTPPLSPPVSLSSADQQSLRTALSAARSKDRSRYDAAVSQINDTEARRIATFALVE